MAERMYQPGGMIRRAPRRRDHRPCMGRVLCHLGHQKPINELEAVPALEDARGDHRLIFLQGHPVEWRRNPRPRPGGGGMRDRGHGMAPPVQISGGWPCPRFAARPAIAMWETLTPGVWVVLIGIDACLER